MRSYFSTFTVNVVFSPSLLLNYSVTAYKRFDIWVKIDQIQDMGHPLCDVDPGHAADMEASFCHHSVLQSGGLISFIPVHPVLELSDPFDFLHCAVESRMMQCHDCHVGVVDERHPLNVLTSLHQSKDMALQSTSDQICVSIISREDEKLFFACMVIMLW